MRVSDGIGQATGQVKRELVNIKEALEKNRCVVNYSKKYGYSLVSQPDRIDIGIEANGTVSHSIEIYLGKCSFPVRNKS